MANERAESPELKRIREVFSIVNALSASLEQIAVEIRKGHYAVSNKMLHTECPDAISAQAMVNESAEQLLVVVRDELIPTMRRTLFSEIHGTEEASH